MKYLLLLSILISTSHSYAKRLVPLYELGMGLTHVNFPNYPGSSSTRSLTLPFPTALYRGKNLRLKREEGARGIFYRGEKFELDISFDGTLASDPEDTKEREGMNELDMLVEVGPRFLYNLTEVTKSFPWDFDFHLATRVAFSAGALERVSEQGVVINPFFTVRRVSFLKDNDLFAASIGAKFASKTWQDYYYTVEPKFETTTRDAFSASSGLAEISFAAFYNYPIKEDVYVFAGSIYSHYSQAKNRDSPLLAKINTTSIVFGIYYNFHKSSKMVLD